MDQKDVIRADVAHEVTIPAGMSSATSVQPTRHFGDSRQQDGGEPHRAVAAQVTGERWAEFDGTVAFAPPQTWAVRPSRITHMGRVAAKRVDFRGPLKALRAKNAEVRERLNHLMAPTQQVMK